MASQQPTHSSDDEAAAASAAGAESRAGGTDGQERAGQEALAGEPEAWEPWETRLVVWSLVIGVVGLLVLGVLVDRFILS